MPDLTFNGRDSLSVRFSSPLEIQTLLLTSFREMEAMKALLERKKMKLRE